MISSITAVALKRHLKTDPVENLENETIPEPCYEPES